jgi:hypothetical protein
LQRICKNFRDFRGVLQISAVKLNANFGICRDLLRRGSVRPSKREDWVRVPCCAGKPHPILSIRTYITVPDSNRPFLCRYEANQYMIPATDYKQSVGKGAAFKHPGFFVQDYQFSVNNVSLPTFRVARDEAFMHLLTQLGLAQDTIEGTTSSLDTLDKWNESHWMCAFNLAALAPADAR